MKLKKSDPEIYKLIKLEEKRQNETLQMIPSENDVWNEVSEVVGSVLMNKYSEGYSFKRYYQGNENIDRVEKLAIERAKQLFKVPYANVQAYSGSPANSAVYFALLEPKDIVMGMELASGGHLTHGHPKVSFSGKYFRPVQYSLEKDGSIDFKKLEKLALDYKPKVIISGATAYSKIIDFEKFGKIADKVGAWHVADISHIAGLIAGETHPSPVPHAHIITSTTHKTLRGPRGAIILVTEKGLKKDAELPVKIDRAVFPGLQGGPHNNITAGIAVCLKNASLPEFKKYAKQVVLNAQSLANELMGFGYKLIGNGTENHLLLVDLRNKKIDGWCAAWALEYAGIIVNRNTVPGETRNPFYPSGIRLGTPFLTSRGMKEKEMKLISKYINQAIDIGIKYLTPALDNPDKEIARTARKDYKQALQKDKNIVAIKAKVKELCSKFKKSKK